MWKVGLFASVFSTANFTSAFSNTEFNIESTCGAVGDNQTLNTAAIQRCIDQAVAFVTTSGSSATVVPSGIFLTGGVTITGPNITLLFDRGGYLQGSALPAAYSLDWDWWHVVTVVNATNFVAVAPQKHTGGIVGNLWSMVKGWNPEQQSWVPQPWEGVGGCVGECRVKNLAVVDSRGVGK